MTKYTVFFCIFIVFMAGWVSHFWNLGSEHLKPGDELVMHVGIWNNRHKEMRDVEINFQILGTDVFINLGEVDILPRTNYGKYVIVEIPKYLKQGDYIVKVNAKSKSGKKMDDTRYRFITII